jgi:hypothetical protein
MVTWTLLEKPREIYGSTKLPPYHCRRQASSLKNFFGLFSTPLLLLLIIHTVFNRSNVLLTHLLMDEYTWPFDDFITDYFGRRMQCTRWLISH